jgi:hypothetical protein
VNNPRKLAAWQLPAERVALGEGYKPSLALLPGGELVLVALFQEPRPPGKVREWTGLWRSRDGGLTWSERVEVKDLISNPDGYTHSYLHRSADGGRTWRRLRIGAEGFPARAVAMCSRDLVEAADGTLLLGVGVNDRDSGRLAWVWTSKDGGKTWDKTGPQVKLGTYQGKAYDNYDAFFTEDFTSLSKAGKLHHFLRCGPPSPMYPMNDGRAVPRGDGGIDRMFTQRSTVYPIGLQAVLGDDDGETWDFSNDRIVIEGKTPWGLAQGGFGNTVELSDGKLLSCSSYRAADNKTYLEVVRWRLPDASAIRTEGVPPLACSRHRGRAAPTRRGRRATGPRPGPAPPGRCSCRRGCRSAFSPSRTRRAAPARRNPSATGGGQRSAPRASSAAAGTPAGR